MPSRLSPSNLASHLLAGILGAALAWTAMPLWRGAVMALAQAEYGALVATCDIAMRDHYQAKLTAANAPSRDAGLALHSAEIGLIVCQDYDLYQKRLQQWGLREAELSQMRLTAIEDRAKDLWDVVATHEIRY